MPKYVYECLAGHQTEAIRRIDDRDAPLTCDCGREAPRVEIAAPTPYVTRPGVGDRSPFSRDRVGK